MCIVHYLNTTGFQTLIIAISVLVTYHLYWRNKKDKLQAAATILTLQIRDIEHNIEYLKSEGITGEAINEQQLHYSKTIFEENMWEKYKHLYASRLVYTDFAAISQFFEVAQAIKTQQMLIKQKILESTQSKVLSYYSQQFNRINHCVTDNSEDRERSCLTDIKYTLELYNRPEFGIMTFITKEYGIGLMKGMGRYQRLTGTTTFGRLCKAGGVKQV